MGDRSKLLRSVCVALINLLLLVGLSWAADPQVTCPDIQSRPGRNLNVLTLNLLFTDVQNLNSRLNTVANFVAGNKVDVVLLQEVLGGIVVEPILSGQSSTAALLQKILRQSYGARYNLSYRVADGIGNLFTVGNAILSRCAMQFTVAYPLPLEPPATPGQIQLLERRNVVLSRLSIPGIGTTDVYTTHLCGDCTSAGRLDQAQALAGFVELAEMSPAGLPVLLGGDFNLNITMGNTFADQTYGVITNDPTSGGLGLIDTYDKAQPGPPDPHNLCKVTGSVVTAPEACTTGVSDITDPFSGPSVPERIDYIFEHGFTTIISSMVFFNPKVVAGQPSVSDHSALVSSVAFP